MPVDVERVAFSQREYRSVSVEESAVKTRHPLAVEMTYNTLLANSADAQDFGQQVLDLRKLNRSTWTCAVNKQNYALEVGDTVQVVYPRFGLANGKNFIVKRVKRDSNLVYDELTLYGPE